MYTHVHPNNTYDVALHICTYSNIMHNRRIKLILKYLNLHIIRS